MKGKTLILAMLSLAVLVGWLWYSAQQPIAAPSTSPTVASADSSEPAVASRNTKQPTTAAAKSETPGIQLTPITVSQACLTADEFKNTFSTLQQQRFLLSQQLTKLHQQLGIEKNQTLELLQAYGGDLEWYQFYQASHKNKEKHNYPSFQHTERFADMPPITVLDFIRFKNALNSGDYQDILAFLQEQPPENRHLLYPDGHFSLLVQIIAKNPDLPLSAVQQLIDAGLRPFFADFAVMTTLDLPLPLITMVQQHYSGDFSEQWRDNYRQYNLTLLAAENHNATLFDYWLALGVPAELGKNAPNAFDLIPLPDNEAELQQQLPKIRTLLSAAMVPRSADLQSQWLLLLPKPEKELLLSLLQQQSAAVTTIDANSNSPDAALLRALQQLQQQFTTLLAQFASCPADILAPDTRWQLTQTPDRALPERRFPKMVARLQQGMPKEQAAETKKATELMLQKNWGLLEQSMQLKGDKQQAEIDIALLQAMVIGGAEAEVLRRQLAKIPALPAKELQIFSIITTPEQHGIFKAAGVVLKEKTK